MEWLRAHCIATEDEALSPTMEVLLPLVQVLAALKHVGVSAGHSNQDAELAALKAVFQRGCCFAAREAWGRCLALIGARS